MDLRSGMRKRERASERATAEGFSLNARAEGGLGSVRRTWVFGKSGDYFGWIALAESREGSVALLHRSVGHD